MDNSRESTMVPSADPSAAAQVTAADSEASPTLKSESVEKAPPPAPFTSHCLGLRGYDGGFYDVGSFFVFRHELRRQQEQLAKDGGAFLEVLGAAPPIRTGKGSPLEYELVEGLRVKVAPPTGGAPAVKGQGSEVAGRAFEVFQRQVGRPIMASWHLH